MNTFRFIIGMVAAAMVAGVGAQTQSGSGDGRSSGSAGTSGSNSAGGNSQGAFGGGASGKKSDNTFGGSSGRTGPAAPGTSTDNPGMDPVRPPDTPPRPNTPPPRTPSEPVRPGEPPTQTDNSTAVQTPVATSKDTWALIQGSNYEQRSDFLNGVDRIGAQADASITTLKRQRSTYAGDPNAWDAEMKRLDDARAYLQSTSQELAKATAANWDERKERVARAWERYQAAYERANGLATP